MHHLQHVVGGDQLTSGLPGSLGESAEARGEIVEASQHNPFFFFFWTQQTNKARCKKQREVEVSGRGHHRPSANAKCSLLPLLLLRRSEEE